VSTRNDDKKVRSIERRRGFRESPFECEGTVYPSKTVSIGRTQKGEGRSVGGQQARCSVMSVGIWGQILWCEVVVRVQSFWLLEGGNGWGGQWPVAVDGSASVLASLSVGQAWVGFGFGFGFGEFGGVEAKHQINHDLEPIFSFSAINNTDSI
jgi:hypothetical protein